MSGGAPLTEKPKADPPTLEFRRLTEHCKRDAFSCGNRDIDKWFRSKAWKHHAGLRSRVVSAHLSNNPHPVAFYAMSMKLERVSHLRGNKGFSLFDEGGCFPTVQLCWVAVSMQRQGFGRVLMGYALHDFYEVAVRTGIYALTLISVDEETTKFYKGLGFVPYGTDSAVHRMLLPAEAVIALEEGA